MLPNQQKTSTTQDAAKTDARSDVFDLGAWDDSFDINDFDEEGADVPAELPDASTVLRRLPGWNNAKPLISDKNSDFLFAGMGSSVSEPRRAGTEIATLWSIVVRAYQEVRNGRSVDYVVAEPEFNILFLQRCWELGAAATPFHLNWMLMNARKGNRLPRPTHKTAVPFTRMTFDQMSFAADIAMRDLQNELYFKEQRSLVSVDEILCNPHLASQFDDRAARIAPGYRSFEYRWAAMSLRKTRRTTAAVGCSSPLIDAGLVEDFSADRIPDDSGLFWIRAERESLFVGVAGSLRSQASAFVDRMGVQVVPEWYEQRPATKPRIGYWRSKISGAECFRTSVLMQEGSLLNFRLYGSLLPAA